MRTEDGYIIQQCLAGDPMAFGLLVDKYKRSIYALAFSRVRNFHDAQDITQEAFIKAYQGLHTLRRWDSFISWIYRITINLCKDWVRSGSKRPDREFLEDQESSDIDNASINSYSDSMLSDSIKESLETLPEIYREVLALRYFGGMNISEMSRFLGVSKRTIDRRINEAMSMLKEEAFAMLIKEQRVLPSSFTFHIIETIKHIKINPISPLKALPFGLTLAIGIIAGFFSINAHFNLNDTITALSSTIGESRVLDVGEYPVNLMKISKMPNMANQQNGDGSGAPSLQNAFFMSPQGKGGEWIKKADMPNMRGGLSGSALNGKIYIIGGMNGVRCFQTVEEYDPVTDKWASKTNISSARWGTTASMTNDRIYVIGGSDDVNDLSFVEEYDPASDRWTKKADMPTARNSLSSSVIDGKIYAIGGFAKGANLSAVEEYDPIKDKWTVKSDMPTIRNGLSTSAVNGKIYAIGGWGGFNEIATVEEYDPKTDRWTKKADMPTARGWLSTVVINGKIYAIGGLQKSFGLPNMEIYDPIADEWTKENDIPTVRGLFYASEFNGKIYVMGGFSKYPDALISTVEEYTPNGWQSIFPQGKLPSTWGQKKTLLK